jgi:hypothetical protein
MTTVSQTKGYTIRWGEPPLKVLSKDFENCNRFIKIAKIIEYTNRNYFTTFVKSSNPFDVNVIYVSKGLFTWAIHEELALHAGLARKHLVFTLEKSTLLLGLVRLHKQLKWLPCSSFILLRRPYRVFLNKFSTNIKLSYNWILSKS